MLTLKPRNGSHLIEFTDFVQPICLPPEDAPYRDGMKCIVSGWGSLGIRTSFYFAHDCNMAFSRYSRALSEYPHRMQAASLPILSREKCAHPSVYGKILSDTAFCAGFLRGGIDSCQGDSGGPFACDMNGTCIVVSAKRFNNTRFRQTLLVWSDQLGRRMRRT